MINLIPYSLALGAFVSAAPSAAASSNDTKSPQAIEWGPCSDLGLNESVPLSCGSLAVPLDYTDPDCKETLDLQILKVPALKQPSKGSVFFNVGGPGASGIEEMTLTGKLLSM